MCKGRASAGEEGVSANSILANCLCSSRRSREKLNPSGLFDYSVGFVLRLATSACRLLLGLFKPLDLNGCDFTKRRSEEFLADCLSSS